MAQIKPIYITKNDLQPAVAVTIKDSAGNPIDLTNATVVFTLKDPTAATPKVNRATATVDPDQTNNTGQVNYTWQAGDTDTAGTYYAEFEVSPQAGGKFTLPNGADGPLKIIITESLDSV